MKILSKGQKWTKRFDCHACKSHLEIEESDLHVVNTARGYGGETWEPALHFECPVCHTDNNVTGKVPSGIQGKLFSEARSKRGT